eukprot:424226-Hanusia_phi.AAC.1
MHAVTAGNLRERGTGPLAKKLWPLETLSHRLEPPPGGGGRPSNWHVQVTESDSGGTGDSVRRESAVGAGLATRLLGPSDPRRRTMRRRR